jgi:hypothetical protein
MLIATPIQVGWLESGCELEFVHEFDFASGRHQPSS